MNGDKGGNRDSRNNERQQHAVLESTGRRLVRYMLFYRGRVGAALLVLVFAMAAQLAGPLVAKTIIDDHITIITDAAWYEYAPADVPADVRSVEFRGLAYVRGDWLSEETAGAVPAGAAAADMKQRGADFTLTSPALGSVELAADDVAAFYRHDVRPVMMLVGLILALALAGSVLNFIQSYMLQSTAQRIVQRIRMDVFRHLHRLPIRFFDNTPVGQVVSRIANDTENIKELYMSFMATFVVSGLNILGVFVMLLVLDWRLALLCFVLLPLYAGIMVIHLKFSHKYVSVIRARLAEMNAKLNEAIVVMPIIQAFRREREIEREFDELNDDRYRNQVMQFRIFAFSGRNAVYFLGRIFTAAIVWYFGSGSLAGAISIGVFYAFIEYLGRIFEPVIGIFDQLMNAQRAVVSAERVFALMDEEGMLPEPEQAGKVTARPEGHVVFDRVTFGYKPDEPVLRDVSLEAKRGETIALVGHTGSGKSSIMNLLLGFYEPQAGSIAIDGRPIADMSKQSLRRHMGIVLQDPFLFTGDVSFNVGLHNDAIDDERIARALQDVGAADFVDKLPQGRHEPVMERGSTMSSGQRQLISFARALAYDPAILILDEATSSVDSETESVIQHALDVLRSGRTTFVIAHRLSTIKDADQILVLHKGVIVERGTHDELMAQQGRYFRMYQLQSAAAG